MNKLSKLVVVVATLGLTLGLGSVVSATNNHNDNNNHHNNGHHQHNCQVELTHQNNKFKDKFKCEGDTDVCPNLEGLQGTVPEGLVKNEQGNCVEEEVTPEPTPTPDPTPAPTPETKPVVSVEANVDLQVPQMK